MHRSKLQKLVQAALIEPQVSISTEGFLGDLASKVGSIFSSRKKILTEEESKELFSNNKALIARLEETVLNSKWLDKAEFKTGEIAAAWAVPGLDYECRLSSDDIVPHLDKVIPRFLSDFKAFRALQHKYSDAINELYDSFVKEIISVAKSGGDIEAVIAKYSKKCDPIIDPIKSLSSKPISVFNNEKFEYNRKTSLLERVKLGSSKVKTIKPLTKEEVVKVAKLIIELINSPLANDSGLKYVIDWEDLRYKLDVEKIPEDHRESIVEMVNDSTIMTRFYHQYAWNHSGTYDGIWEHNSLIKKLFQLIDASVK